MLSGLVNSESSSRGSDASSSRCAPPRRFRSAEGVLGAWPRADGPFTNTPSLRGKSEAQKKGLRYERKVHAELSAEYGKEFSPSQWFEFLDASGKRWCQVDGLRRSPSGIVIFEVKYTFTSDAWFQLRKLYEPVIRRAYPGSDVHSVIVCCNLDPWTAFPEAYTIIHSLSAIRSDVLCVLPWRL